MLSIFQIPYSDSLYIWWFFINIRVGVNNLGAQYFKTLYMVFQLHNFIFVCIVISCNFALEQFVFMLLT